MIRLTGIVSDRGFIYTLAHDGVLVLTTGSREEAEGQMVQLGIEHPLQLIEAAEHWSVVEIREEEKPSWRGG